jgi:aminopeptidase N
MLLLFQHHNPQLSSERHTLHPEQLCLTSAIAQLQVGSSTSRTAAAHAAAAAATAAAALALGAVAMPTHRSQQDQSQQQEQISSPILVHDVTLAHHCYVKTLADETREVVRRAVLRLNTAVECKDLCKLQHRSKKVTVHLMQVAACCDAMVHTGANNPASVVK